MNRILLLVIALVSIASPVLAQTDKEVKDAIKPADVVVVDDTAHHYWKKGAFVGINFGQAALVNWAAGGQNTITLQLNANGFINYQRGKLAWDNTMNFSLGGIVQGHILGARAARLPAFRKNVDNLQLTSRVGYILDKKKKWMAAFLADYKTSVINGYDYTKYDADPTVTAPQRISSPFSPSYLILSLGVNYKPVPYVSFYLSPLAGKLSFVDPKTIDSGAYVGVTTARVDETRYGFNRGVTFRHQLGAYFRFDFQKDIIKNVNLKTSLELFTPYTKETIYNHDPIRDSSMVDASGRGIDINTLGKVDVNWLTNINFKVNKFITCSLEWQLVYSFTTLVPRYRYSDAHIEQRYNTVQFREGFTLGFGYKFAQK